jgi:hypothetical protein
MQKLRMPPSDISGQRFIILFSIVWIGFSTLFTVLAWSDPCARMMGMAFVAIGFAILLFTFWRRFAVFKVGKPELSLSKMILRLGDAVSVSYDQTFNRVSDVQHINVDLVFRESATYTRGTDTTTDTHEKIIDTYESPGRLFQAGETFQQDYTFTIPADAMHTFLAEHNKLQWFIRLWINVTGWPDLREEFEIQVLPERML